MYDTLNECKYVQYNEWDASIYNTIYGMYLCTIRLIGMYGMQVCTKQCMGMYGMYVQHDVWECIVCIYNTMNVNVLDARM